MQTTTHDAAVTCDSPECTEPAVEDGKKCIKHEGGFGLTVDRFRPQTQVELHPGCDRWMMGDRYGTVTGIIEGRVRVRLHRSGKSLLFEPERLKYAR
jgi:hypothetical protein